MRVAAFLLLAACACAAAASEVTVMRPSSIISQEWAYYIIVGDRAVADLQAGERVTLQVPPDTRSLVIQCPTALGGYEESRLDYDFKSNPTAFFVLSPRSDCVAIRALDAKAAASFLRETRVRANRALEYDKPRAITPAASAAAPASAPAAAADARAKDPIGAATAAWVEAFNSRDAARLSALYDGDAVLTDAGESGPRVGAAAIADYYKEVVRRPTQRAALGERSVRRFGDTAIDSGSLTYFEMRDGTASTTPGRYSLTYQNRGGRWLIVDHHVSPAPR
jgi:uncharacterized protein (TIGR02246 family)